MPTPIYMSIEGETQGKISEGASSDDSIGNIWQQGHENEIMVQKMDHSVLVPTNPQNGQPAGPRRHEPLFVTKILDKSSPLLYNALASGERLNVELKWYRTANDGTQEHYFSVALEEAVLVDISACMEHCQDKNKESYGHEEKLAINYRKIEWRHEVAGTSGQDDWRDPAA